MKPTLVTGATGFLGWHVARRLLDRGESVRALVRDRRRLKELEGVEPFDGDLRDAETVRRAAAGCGTVFHVAADYRLWARNPAELFESNVGGTRNVMEAAEKAGVERVVYTSTVGCIGMNQGTGDESTPVSLEQMTGPYKRSKFLAEQEARRARVPVVIVNPTAPVGDHDWKPTPTGQMIVDFLNGRMPAYIDTGLNLCDAGDTAGGHLLARDRGRPGERYILAGENLTLRRIFETLAGIAGVAAPRFRMPYALAWSAGAASTLWAEVTGSPPRVPLDAVRMARTKMWVDGGRARRELGFEARPAAEALRRAVNWFRDNG
ncbi:MAG: hopanoid-associated sugar epimerase, partial [Bryobacteraceae bacterium]